MPKKKNFLGGMQNYNPNTGEYESRLTKADGTPATKENMPGGEETTKSKEFAVSESDSKSFKGFKKTTITPIPEWAKKIDDEFKPKLEKARKKTAETESRLKKLAEKSGIGYNEIKNEYVDRIGKLLKEKRFTEEELEEGVLGDAALNLLEEDINSKITNGGSKEIKNPKTMNYKQLGEKLQEGEPQQETDFNSMTRKQLAEHLYELKKDKLPNVIGRNRPLTKEEFVKRYLKGAGAAKGFKKEELISLINSQIGK